MRVKVGIALVAAALLVVGIGLDVASGERSQVGNLVVSLDGRLQPLKLPRDHDAPVSLQISGGLESADGSLLPRVARVEVGLPGQGETTPAGLPRCPLQRLRYATVSSALAACGSSKVGEGELSAEVVVPGQDPFTIEAKVLAFNGADHGRPAVLLDAISSRPPLQVIVPFAIEHRAGRFGTVLVGDLPPSALGAEPHAASVSMTIGRRFSSHGKARSFLSASCPLPSKFTAGFFPFADIRFTFGDGSPVGTEITRSCRAAPTSPTG